MYCLSNSVPYTFISPYLIIVLIICSTSSGPTFQLRLHHEYRLSAPILLFQLHEQSSFIFGNTLIDTSRNCSSVYGGRCRRLNRDCDGLDNLISLHAANTFAPLILKSYCLRIWSLMNSDVTYSFKELMKGHSV